MNIFNQLYRALANKSNRASLYEVELVEKASGIKHRHMVKAFSRDDAIKIAIDITSEGFNLRKENGKKANASKAFPLSKKTNFKAYLKPNVIQTYKANAQKLTNASGFKAGHFIKETTRALRAGQIDTVADVAVLRSKAQTGINVNIIACFCWIAILVLSLIAAGTVYSEFDSSKFIGMSPLISMSFIGCIASPLGIVISIRNISVLSKFLLIESKNEDESGE